jgi:hypothetical protein
MPSSNLIERGIKKTKLFALDQNGSYRIKTKEEYQSCENVVLNF